MIVTAFVYGGFIHTQGIDTPQSSSIIQTTTLP